MQFVSVTTQHQLQFSTQFRLFTSMSTINYIKMYFKMFYTASNKDRQLLKKPKVRTTDHKTKDEMFGRSIA